MTIKQSLAKWLETNGFGTVGTDIFLDTVPLEKNKVAAFWITGGGGTPTTKAHTGEKAKAYLFQVFFRDTDSQNVDETLQSVEETANAGECHELEGYNTIELEATGFQNDLDIDQEDRTVGVVEITVTVYQSN